MVENLQVSFAVAILSTRTKVAKNSAGSLEYSMSIRLF